MVLYCCKSPYLRLYHGRQCFAVCSHGRKVSGVLQGCRFLRFLGLRFRGGAAVYRAALGTALCLKRVWSRLTGYIADVSCMARSNRCQWCSAKTAQVFFTSRSRRITCGVATVCVAELAADRTLPAVFRGSLVVFFPFRIIDKGELSRAPYRRHMPPPPPSPSSDVSTVCVQEESLASLACVVSFRFVMS